MKKSETIQIISLLAGNYESIANKSDKQKSLMINSWQECLKDLDYPVVLQSIKKIMIESVYPPTIADIRKNVVDIINPIEYDPLEAWNECYSMISRGNYMTQEEFEQYSPVCKKFIGSINQLRNYAMVETDTINTVVKSNFLKQYEILKNRERQESVLPIDMKEKMFELQRQAIKYIEG